MEQSRTFYPSRSDALIIFIGLNIVILGIVAEIFITQAPLFLRLIVVPISLIAAYFNYNFYQAFSHKTFIKITKEKIIFAVPPETPVTEVPFSHVKSIGSELGAKAKQFLVLTTQNGQRYNLAAKSDEVEEIIQLIKTNAADLGKEIKNYKESLLLHIVLFCICLLVIIFLTYLIT